MGGGGWGHQGVTRKIRLQAAGFQRVRKGPAPHRVGGAVGSRRAGSAKPRGPGHPRPSPVPGVQRQGRPLFLQPCPR